MNKEIRKSVYDKYDGHCAYCGDEIEYKDMQVDHFVPQRLGGTDDIDNLMPSCRLCNHYKRGNKIETFRNSIATIPDKLHGTYIYKVGLKYENVVENKKDIGFYFEWLEENT